jgi:hypothetical protein
VLCKNKTIKSFFWYVLALIILASLILIVHVRRDVALPRLPNAESVSQEIDNVKTEVVERVEKEPSSTEATADLSAGALAQADKTAGDSSFASSDAEALADKKAMAGEGKKLPEKILIDVPFTSQAPFGKWDAYHEEACEEASLLMVAYFLQNKKLTPAVAEKEIQALIAYEIKTTKKYEDSTAQETAKLGADYYGLNNLRVVYDFTADDLKKYLAQKKPIIIPAAGRLLGNPNFTAPGPLYHNLVLIGYDGDTIITNDPGTRKGQNYRYGLKTLYGAIHDFPGDKNKITTGKKAMIVIE